MSVINTMLRDLDRRNAPLPIKTNVQATFEKNSNSWVRVFVMLCFVIAAMWWTWSHYSTRIFFSQPRAIARHIATEKSSTQIQASEPAKNSSTSSLENSAIQFPLPPGEGKGEGSVLAKNSLTPTPLSEGSKGSKGEGKTAPETKTMAAENAAPEEEEKLQPQSVIRNPAHIVKQERNTPEDLNDERYQLARAALAQHQPERAYELLRDNPPALANARDYHAVLAAVEQQLAHYADASLRYQQLLMLDQNQASWWLGLALSLEGQQRGAEAFAAYRRAIALNSLPEAARQYAAMRMSALDAAASTHSAE